MTDGSELGVRPLRLLLAAIVGLACWAAAFLLPFADTARPAAAAAVLGVTGLTTTCWLAAAMPIGVASLLPVVLLPVLSAAPMDAVVRGYGNPILWLFAGGFVLAQAIEKWGLHRRIALSVVAFVGARPRRLVLGFFLAATATSLWINNTSVALMLLPIGWAIVDRTIAAGVLPERAARNFGAGIMLAIAYGASIGGMGTPIGTAPNALFFGNYESLVAQGAPPLTFLQWFVAFGPYVLLLAVVFSWLLTAVVLPLPRGELQHADAMLAEARALGPMTVPERRVALLFFAAALAWITRGDVRFGDDFVVRGWAWWIAPAGQKGTYVHDGVVAIAVAIAAFVIPAGGTAGRGRRLMDWEAVQELPFDILFLLGAGLAMADAFEPTGLSHAFGELLRPHVTAMHPLALVAILSFAILLLSEIASNTAIAALFMPIVKQGAIAAHLDPRMLMLPATLAASCGFMLPIATPPNTIVFASRRVSMGQMVKAGFALDLLSIALLVVTLWWWVFPWLGIDPGAAPSWTK